MCCFCFCIFIQNQHSANVRNDRTGHGYAVVTKLPSCDPPQVEQLGHHQLGASELEAPHPRGHWGFAFNWVHCGCFSISEQIPRQMKPPSFSANGLSHLRGLHHSSRFLPRAALGPELVATYFLTNHWATLKASLPQSQALITVGTAGATQISLLAWVSSQRAPGRSSCPGSFQVVLACSRC